MVIGTIIRVWSNLYNNFPTRVMRAVGIPRGGPRYPTSCDGTGKNKTSVWGDEFPDVVIDDGVSARGVFFDAAVNEVIFRALTCMESNGGSHG
ncbi:hypothetical protein CHELA20_11148 [Hyphomicrobiales bacterium]|nr:hypothetical protein CHELA20_11148 [Hyphomicrobiales bacterium]CAH1695035.1 hypothetical protein CHELA41_51378 [Hyphomicrobiales bacterium]